MSRSRNWQVMFAYGLRVLMIGDFFRIFGMHIFQVRCVKLNSACSPAGGEASLASGTRGALSLAGGVE